MQTHQQPPARAEEKRRLVDVVAHVVHRLRYVLWALLIGAAAFLVVWFAWNEVARRRTAESTLRVEQAQELYDEWSTTTDATKKGEIEADLLARLDGIVARYPRRYGGQRALLLRANLRFAQQAWAPAAADYELLARRFAASYLAPIALFNAGVCLEEQGDAAGARARYEEVADRWKEAAIAARALFGAGRLAEGAEAWEEARGFYERLDAEWPLSQWNQLAANRIVALKVAGKIQ